MAFSAHKLEPHDDPSQVGAEIEQVVGILQEYAGRVLPCVQPNTGRRWRDNVLSGLYAKSRQLVRGWLNGRLSDGFPVRQGSVLSPTLFLLVMDHLLRDLQMSGVGLSINSFYAAGLIHANDIRTLVSSETSLMKQFDMVKLFAKKHHLKFQCEIVVVANRQSGADNLLV